MTSSMTSFARKECRDEQGELIWELRSVNHRYLEPFVRLPEELRALEPAIRESLGKRLGRGKIDCHLRYKPSQAVAELHVNERLANQIIDAAGVVGHMLHEAVPPSAMDILRWPGVLEAAERDFTPVQRSALELLDEALDSLIDTRRREGARLAELIAQRCAALKALATQVKRKMPEVLGEVKARMSARLEELAGELDGGRLEQEMALVAQRLDVDEELDRLSAHLDEVERVLRQEEPVGRRLDFLMQELNRETNTLASKSNDGEVSRTAVEMKVLIEQMREQVQNIE